MNEEALPSAASPSARACRRGTALILLASLVVAGAMLLSSALLRLEPHGAARVAVALLPLPPLLAMFYVIRRVITGLDELHVRMQLEALAGSFVLDCVLIVLVGQLQRAGYVEPGNWSDVYALMSLSYVACYLLVAWRYR
jgi:hypothetical protein